MSDPPWLSPALLRLTTLLLESHERLYGRPLVQARGSRLAAQELFVLDRVVLCHDGGSDPVFTYANRAALTLFERPWSAMVGLPSRFSARQRDRLQRQQALDLARRQQAITGYSGERVASSGRRFQIRGARLWSLIDSERCYHGQAACFGDWWWEP